MEWWALVPAYLLGSVQPGLLIVRLTQGRDVRGLGSGKTGVTNVLRAAGKRAAAVVLALDLAKGALPPLLARALWGDPWLEAAAAAAVLLGHVFPAFAGFRGGRGVAPGVGAAAALLPWAGLAGIAAFAPAVLLTRYVSLGSMLGVLAAMGAFVVAAAAFGQPLPHLWFALACGPLVIAMHRDNIARLLRGEERRLGDRDA